jgi:NTE family protein
VSTALVLAGGGEVAMAWESGIISGLRDHGVDLTEADVIIGTSAGSVVGATIAGGHDPGQALVPSAGSYPQGPPAVDLDAMVAAVGPALDESLNPGEVRRQVGRNALAASVVHPENFLIDAFTARLPDLEWPDRRLLITASDAMSGDLVVWDRNSTVSLALAVASSYSVPGVFTPVTIGGRAYVDGGLPSPTNADLAGDADVVIVLHPLSALISDAPLNAELARLTTKNVAVVTPDEAAAAVFGSDLLDPASWTSVFQIGLDQAATVAKQLRPTWEAGR